MRKFFSSNIPCKAGCKYCFAKWENIYSEFPRLESEKINEKESIIYPCCDGDFFSQKELIDNMRNIAAKSEKVYFSISTKFSIIDEEIDIISKFNDELISQNKGFVKLAISLSNISMINEIEPGTSSYTERLQLAEKLFRTRLLFAVTIKPILPFVPIEEYYKIMDDFSKYTKYFLIGGLYINKKSTFYSQYIKPETPVNRRIVEWLPEHPDWDYIQDEKQFKLIRKYAKKNGLYIFDSDVDLIKFDITKR